MAEITEPELRDAIAGIIKDADLSDLSSKKVRRQLEERFDSDLTDRKKEIDKILVDLINETEEESDEDERNGENGAGSDNSDVESDLSEPEPPKKKPKPAKKPAAKPAAKPKSRPNSKVKSAQKVESSGDEDGENDDDVDDEELARKLQDEENSRTRHRSAKKVKKQVKSDKQKKPRAAGTSTYSRPCDLTPELAEVVGSDKMARKDVVKTIWDIVKERNLQDPKNRQFMICDDQLLKVFGKKRIRTFGMMKYLKNHIINH